MKRFIILPIVLGFLFASVAVSNAQTGTVTATVRSNPLKIKVTAPANVKVREWFEIEAEVSNLGTESIKKTQATISVSPELQVTGKKKNIGKLGPGKTRTVLWRARAKSSENFVIQAEVTGELGGEQISATDSTVINIITSSTVSFFSSFFRLASRFL